MYANTVAEAHRTLMRGFTTVRDVGGSTFGLKAAIDSGVIPGSRARAFHDSPLGLPCLLTNELLNNILAGASRYRLELLLPFAIVGRVIWTAAYLGLGYGFGVALEEAANVTSNLGGFLVSLLVLTVLGFMIRRNQPPFAPAQR